MKINRIFYWIVTLIILFACSNEDNLLPVESLNPEDQSGALRMADNPNEPFTAMDVLTAIPEVSIEPHQNKFIINTIMNSHVSSEHLWMNGEMITRMEGLWDMDMTGPVTGEFEITLTDGSKWKGNIQGKRHKTDESTWNWTGHYIGKGYGGQIEGMQILFLEEIESYEPTPMILSSILNGKIIAR